MRDAENFAYLRWVYEQLWPLPRLYPTTQHCVGWGAQVFPEVPASQPPATAPSSWSESSPARKTAHILQGLCVR
jgi:hypothetical protein